jgi:hypothetical protein
MFTELISGVLQGWLWTPLRTGLIFWLGGLILWLLHIINWQAVSQLLQNHIATNERFIRQEWLGVGDFLRHLPKPEALLALLVLVSIILLSGIVVKASQFGLLRLLEGYGWPSGLRTWRVNYYEKQYQTQFARWEILANKGTSRTPAENWEYASLDKEMVIYSHDMPTRLGNILRGYEQRPREKYGLDMIICWPRLWLLLPQSTQEELSTARAALDEAIQVIAWGALFLIWMVWGEWLALLMALLLIWGGYRLALQSVDVYGQLLDATFDVHRHLLYQALHWQFPENPAEERKRGAEMTQYLWRGADS